MKRKNWFWGIFFLAAAVFVIACQFGAFVHIGFWSIAATVLLAAVFVASLFDLNFWGIFVPAALLYAIYQAPLHLPALQIWQTLLAAVLASMGLSLLFHRHFHPVFDHGWNGKKWCDRHDVGADTQENLDGNEILVRSSFNESCRYLHADSLRRATLSSSFGKLGVYFDQVKLDPQGAVADIDVSFGDMTLYIPAGWNVDCQLHNGFGSVEGDNRRSSPGDGAPHLTLTGTVSFGKLDIRYV